MCLLSYFRVFRCISSRCGSKDSPVATAHDVTLVGAFAQQKQLFSIHGGVCIHAQYRDSDDTFLSDLTERSAIIVSCLFTVCPNSIMLKHYPGGGLASSIFILPSHTPSLPSLQVVRMNPYAALCSHMLSEAIDKLKRGEQT